MRYIIEIPEELFKAIVLLGYDINSYFDEVFIKPLVIKHRTMLEIEVIEKAKPEIDEKVEQVADAIVLESVVEKPVDDAPPAPKPVEEPPIKEPPAETPIEP
jgi:hypothetical protein